jgi:hypothetical protein
MNFDDQDDELAGLIEQPDSDMLRVIPRGVANNGRVNPVQRQLQREQPQQPQINPFIINNRTPGAMPSNGGGRKKKRTSKHSKKYKNKNYKNKNRKHQTRKTRRVMKKRK